MTQNLKQKNYTQNQHKGRTDQCNQARAKRWKGELTLCEVGSLMKELCA